MISDRRRWVVLFVLIVSLLAVLLVYGIISGGDASSWKQRRVLGPIAADLVVVALFCGHESRTEYPALNVRLFRDPRLSSAATAISLNFFAMAGVYFFMRFYLQNVRGYSPLHAGLLTTPVAIGQLVAASRSAPLVSRFGAKVVMPGGLLLVTGALTGYHSLSQKTPIVALELIFLLLGAGMGIVMPTATDSVMSVAPREHGGAGSAITNTSRRVAVALGVALTTADQAFVYAMRLTTVVSITIAVCGAVLIAFWMPGRKQAVRGTGAASAAVADPAGPSARCPSARYSAGRNPAGPACAGRGVAG